MYMDFSLNLSQEQKLIMTQQMQLSIKLLQMSTYDLKEYIEKEFSENPVLEAQFNIENSSEGEKEKSLIDYKELVKYLEFDNYSSQNYSDYKESDITPFTFISNEKSLKEYLHEQILEHKLEEYLKTICDYLIENIDKRGYLEGDLEEIAKEINVKESLAKKALQVIQELEPLGIGARNLKECLIIQLKDKKLLNDITLEIVNSYLEELADNKYQVISKKLKISVKEAQYYGDVIKNLEPKPARGYYTGDEVKFIIPDAEIRNIDGEFFIIMSDSLLPKLSINPMYREIVKDKSDEDCASYVKEKISKAMFLIKSIEQRRGTLYKVLERILIRQKEYFEKGIRHLKPMTIKEIAEDIGMHESTVSRAIREKYILTTFGTVKIRDLFSIGLQTVSNKESDENMAVINIKKTIEEIIKAENKMKPLSDQNISDILEEKGIHISRRTVAKYREEIGIKSSSKRKRF